MRSSTVDKAMNTASRLEKSGDFQSAASVYSALLKRFPKNRRAAKNLTKLRRLTSEKLVNTTPQSADQLQACIDLFNQGQPDRAQALGKELAAGHKNSAAFANLMGAIHMSTGDRGNALDWFQRAANLSPGTAAVHNNLGIALGAVRNQQAAIQAFKTALSLQPPFPQAWNNLGLAYRAIGDLGNAMSCFEKAIAEDRTFAEAHHNLSSIFQFEGDHDYSERLTQLYDEASNQNDKCLLAFAIAKAKEAHQDYEGAFNHLLIGNKLRKVALGYDIQHDIRLFDAIQNAFPTAIAGTSSRLVETLRPGPRPIFIVGMPRSGTTLVEQILSRHEQVHAAGEINTLDRALKPFLDEFLGNPTEATLKEIAPDIRERYLAEVLGATGATIAFTDKMPINFRWIGFIAAALPEAKIVVVERKPAAVLWSNFKTHFNGSGNGFAYDLVDLKSYHKLYSGIIDHWSNVLPGRFHVVDYEKLVTDDRKVVQELLEYCDLPWREACLSPQESNRSVDTASAMQVRKKIYRGSSENWRRYEASLKKLGALADLEVEPSG